MHNITESTLRDLLECKGFTDVQAAQHLKVSKETIRRKRKSLGISPKPKRPQGYYSLTQEQDSLISNLYDQGFNDYEVADKMKLGRNRLRKWREKRGVPSKSNKRQFTEEDARKMNELICEGQTLTCVGKKFKTQRTSVSRCLKKYGYKYEAYRPTHPEWVKDYKLSDQQEQVLLGDLLGDGCLVPTSEKSAYMQFGHAIDQELFVRWKASVMDPLTSRTGSNISYNTVFSKTWTSPELGVWFNTFYPEGKKVITPFIIKKLKPLGLATWFMGDGSRSKKTVVFHAGVKIDALMITKTLNKVFGEMFEARKYEREWHIRVCDIEKFCKITCPHIIDYFRYKIPEEYHRFFSSSEYTSELFIRSQDFKRLPLDRQNEIIQKMSDYYRIKGFPYPSYGYNKIRKDCKILSLLECTDLSKVFKNSAGRIACNNFMPHRFDSKRYDSNPMGHWNDPVKYKAFIKNRLTYSNGSVTDSSIRTGISLKGLPANFSPVVSKYIYQKYGKKEGSVLDFSAGYGGRLLGWMSSGLKGKYYGVDPSEKSYQGLCRMVEFCSKFFHQEEKDIHLYHSPFEDVSFEKEKFNLVFSSPPYFGLERYSDEATQSFNRYPDYSDWLNNFWRVVVSTCVGLLNSGGFFVYSIGNYKDYDLIKDTRLICSSCGLKEVPENQSVVYHNVYTNKNKKEGIFVYSL